MKPVWIACLLLTCLAALSCGEEGADPAMEPPTPLPGFEDLPEREALPSPLVTLDGAAITSAQQWRATGRPEALRLLEHYAYGQATQEPVNLSAQVQAEYPDFLEGRGTLKLIELRYGPGQQGRAQLLLALPSDAPGPVPVLLGLNFFGNQATTEDPRVPLASSWVPGRGVGVQDNQATEATRGAVKERWPYARVLERGYGLATLYHGDLDPDYGDDSKGVQALYRPAGQAEPGEHDWGSVAAWSWGLSRAVDYLVTDPDVDAARIATVGHSRNGKAALWSAALDERIAMSVSHMSGCMGAALSRRREGETVAAINLFFPHWFADALHRFDDQEARLPFDQHYLIALQAPRPSLVISGAEDSWADPEGEFLGAREASPVYELLGQEGLEASAPPEPGGLIPSRLGYALRPGGHEINQGSWEVILDFADLHLKP